MSKPAAKPVSKSSKKTKQVFKRSGPPSTHPSTISAMRQEFLAGASIRQLSAKYSISSRTIGKYSSLGGWEKERNLATVPQGLAVVEAAADARVLAERRTWGQRVEVLAGQCADVAEKAGALLKGRDLSNADFRELASLVKIMIGSLADLRNAMPAGMSAGAEPIDADLAALTDAELEAIVRGG